MLGSVVYVEYPVIMHKNIRMRTRGGTQSVPQAGRAAAEPARRRKTPDRLGADLAVNL